VGSLAIFNPAARGTNGRQAKKWTFTVAAFWESAINVFTPKKEWNNNHTKRYLQLLLNCGARAICISQSGAFGSLLYYYYYYYYYYYCYYNYYNPTPPHYYTTSTTTTTISSTPYT
jgi:hypothetical protein